MLMQSYLLPFERKNFSPRALPSLQHTPQQNGVVVNKVGQAPKMMFV
jgi:ribosomal protein S12